MTDFGFEEAKTLGKGGDATQENARLLISLSPPPTPVSREPRNAVGQFPGRHRAHPRATFTPVLIPPHPQVPMARASILWLIGEYCEHVPKIAPDVLRKMAKSFTAEEDIVKLQVINLAAKLYLTNSKQVQVDRCPIKHSCSRKRPRQYSVGPHQVAMNSSNSF